MTITSYLPVALFDLLVFETNEDIAYLIEALCLVKTLKPEPEVLTWKDNTFVDRRGDLFNHVTAYITIPELDAVPRPRSMPRRTNRDLEDPPPEVNVRAERRKRNQTKRTERKYMFGV